MRRALRFSSRAAAFVFALVLLYGLLLAFPEPLFAHRIEEGESFPRLLEEALAAAKAAP